MYVDFVSNTGKFFIFFKSAKAAPGRTRISELTFEKSGAFVDLVPTVRGSSSKSTPQSWKCRLHVVAVWNYGDELWRRGGRGIETFCCSIIP